MKAYGASFDRRALLRTIASGAATLATSSACAQNWMGGLAGKRGRPLVGSAVNPRLLNTDRTYRNAIAQHCGIIVPEGGLKWAGLRPSASEFWFGPPDDVLAFAAERGKAVRGHTLVWHIAMPEWTKEIGSARAAEAAMVHHIVRVVQRYAGRIVSWDVVNEPLPEDPQSPSDRRQSLWFRHLGEDYLRLALQITHSVDPSAQLVINEYDLEHAGARFARRRAGMLHLLSGLKKAGAPVHALGLQGHLRGERGIDRAGLKSLIREVRDMGLDILVTELDVMDHALPADMKLRDAAVAEKVDEFLDAVFEECVPRAVLTWGLTDLHAWIPEHFKRRDGLENRPLPLDATYQEKPFMQVLRRFCDQ